MIVIDLNEQINKEAHVAGEEARELDQTLTRLQTLLRLLPKEHELRDHKLTEMVTRFTDAVTSVYVVCTVLEIKTQDENLKVAEGE